MAEFGLKQIGQIGLVVRDLARAVEFYRDTLGMHFLFSVPNMAFFDCSGIRLLLALPERPDSPALNSVIYYKVGDLSEAHAALADRGVPFEANPHRVARLEDHDLWLAFLRDPDGNLVGLMNEVPHS